MYGLATVLVYSLILIFVPSLREVGEIKWPFVVMYLVVMGRDIFMDYKAGHLTTPLSKIPGRKFKNNALSFLSATCGTVALILVL